MSTERTVALADPEGATALTGSDVQARLSAFRFRTTALVDERER